MSSAPTTQMSPGNPTALPPVADGRKKDFVVCIDFGSYGTSFAYGLTSDENKDINVEARWPDSDIPYAIKNPTQTLYKNGVAKPIAFGFTAEDLYSKFDESEAGQHTLLRRLKLGLYKNSTAQIVDPITGCAYNVTDAIALYLKRINELVWDRLQLVSSMTVDPKKIKYVITVPAIWSESAIGVMRTALQQANIISDEPSGESDCMFVSEPEAACTFCMLKAPEINANGKVFMAIDAGGGTVDLSVHKIEDKKLKEVTVRNGGVCGSMSIDEKFFEWLKSCFQPGVIADMFKAFPHSYRQLLKEWETTKINSKNFEQPKNFSSLPDPLKQLVQQGKLITPEAFRGGKLCLSPDVQKNIFEEALQKVVQLASDQLDQTRATLNVDYILLVGGFGRCPHLYSRLVDKFETTNLVKKVLLPPDCAAAVVSGGVLLGLDPKLIRSRCARQTCIF